jgi:hypothetical protein
MKFLKFFKQKSYEEHVAKICKKYDIKNWYINSNGLVDVHGDVDLSEKRLTKLPFNFGYVSGYFGCTSNKLTSLEGSPQIVGGSFDCSYNYLTSLKGCPQSVGGQFICYNNQLTSLRFAPEEVGGKVYILPNPISDIPKKYLTIEYLEFIVKEQNNDWRLYRKDGSIYPERLKQMIEWGIETNKIKPL